MQRLTQKANAYVRLVPRFLCGSLLTLSALGDTLLQMPSSPSPLEQFKEFIASPPIISNLIVQKKVPTGGGIIPLDGSFAQSTAFEYYQSRLQPGSVFFRKYLTASDETNFVVAGQLVSVFDRQSRVFDGNSQLTTWDDRDPSVLGKRSSIFYSREYYLRTLSEFLNLGLMHSHWGSIRWNGDAFMGEGIIDDEHVILSGELFSTSSGLADRLKVRYTFVQRNASYDYILRYSFDPPLQFPFLPSCIKNFLILNGREIEVGEFRILHLETNSLPMVATAFDVTGFVDHYSWTTRVYTNGSLYVLSTNGTSQFLSTFEEVTNPALSGSVQQRHKAFEALYVVWIAINYGFFILFMRVRKLSPLERVQSSINENGKIHVTL